MATRRADVAVIGAGVLGTFHALFAARKGCKTVLIERNEYPNDASTRNFGMIARSIVAADSPWAAYARASAEIYRSLQEECDISVRVTGSLYLASTELERRVLREFAQADATAARTAGSAESTAVYLDGEDACRRYPFVRDTYCRGALLFPDDLTLEPRRMLRQVIPHLARQGLVEYVPHTTALSVKRSGQGCMVTDNRGTTTAADRVIVCGGADCRTLFPGLLEDSGLRLCKLQMMQTTPQPLGTLPHAILSGLSIRRYPAFASCPSYRALLDEPIDERLRAHGIHLLFKQAHDGAVVIGDSHQYASLEDAGQLEESTSPPITSTILAYGRRMLDLPSWDIERLWNGYYLTYPEREIYTETIDGAIHIVTGVGGKGMTTGPGYARHSIDTLIA